MFGVSSPAVRARITRLSLACVALVSGALLLAGAPSARAADTVWICKPGQSDDLCAGTIAGKTMPAPGQALRYTRAQNPPVDCFYLYPTQSGQSTPNSNLDKDPEIRRVVVQQARMFSTVCNVYAPMYRQVTYSGDQSHDSPEVEIAYASARSAFRDFLQNYNGKRGFIMLGHSQGSAHTARLIDELVDPDPNLRRRFAGAFAPGANINVPIGKNVGGMYENIPACSRPGQFGCLVAYSMYNGYPGDTPMFSNLGTGYWIYPAERPDPEEYEAVCTDPSVLSGSPGRLSPLLNNDYLLSVPATETPAPWREFPDQVTSECARQNGNHWLDVDFAPNADAFLTAMVGTVASGNNYHVPEVNVAEANLLKIAASQSSGWAARNARRNSLLKQQKKLKKSLKKQSKAAGRAGRQCRVAKKKRRSSARRACSKAGKARAQVRRTRKKLAQVKRQLGQLD